MVENSSGWTVEKELLKLSCKPTIDIAVHALGLLREGQEFMGIEGASSWIMGGSETYICPFSVLAGDGSSNPFILKIIVAFSPARSIDNLLKEWTSRRRLIEKSGVKVPKLLFSGEGIVLEEFIPYALKDVLKMKGDTDKLIVGVFQYAGVLALLRFRPIGAFHDLRTDGINIIPVDFGEDLGPAGVAESGSMKLYFSALEWLRTCGIQFQGERLKELQNIFLANQ